MAFRSFEELEVWKRSCQMAVLIYAILKESRDLGLRDQMQRAAVSVASNIAEGYERGGKDLGRFLRIAQGSAAELQTQVYIAGKIGAISLAQCREIVDELQQLSKMLNALRKSINPKP